MIKEIRGFKFSFNIETVMNLMHCNKKSSIYDEMVEEFNKLSIRLIDYVNAVALISLGEIDDNISTKEVESGSKVIYCVLTIGDKLSKMSSKAFSDGDYVSSIMIDAMADDVLFQFDDYCKKYIIDMAKSQGYGIKKRLEAPNDIDMKSQLVAWKCTESKKRAGIDITEGYMFNPVKTISEVYVLDVSCDEFNVDHDCSRCKSLKCPLRSVKSVPVNIKTSLKSTNIMVKNNQSLLDALLENKIYVSSICGGKGICGKCSIKVIDGELDITEYDRRYFTDQDLKEGKRLSCKSYPKSPCTISIEINEDDFYVVSDYGNAVEKNNTNDSKKVIVIDIGTTTIAIQLIDEKKNVINTYTSINHQRRFGADVISRIDASNNGKKEELRLSILDDLSKGIIKILDDEGDSPKGIFISGNTTMIHLLLGYPCNTLGVSPFTPYSVDMIHSNIIKIFGNKINSKYSNIPVEILPCISTFIGADIVAGMIACSLDKDDNINLFIDLGTNGEMAIGNKDKILVTSTAAGPAFEGGNIKYGVGSISGAVSNVEMKNGKIESIKTIGDKNPIGICGTGVIEIVSELFKEDLIDETGLLDEEYFDDGFPIATREDGELIYITSKDIREIQLAKSAVRAGIETLLSRYGVKYNDICNLYIAGGFGYKMNEDKAINIGMFPAELKNKIKIVGNTSLQGSAIYATDSDANIRAKKICEICEEINLSTDKVFNDAYMKYMYFGDEE